MIYYLDDKRIFFIPTLYKKLGKGSEGYAYLYKGKVLKRNINLLLKKYKNDFFLMQNRFLFYKILFN